MIVVADTSPLNYLILIGVPNVLHELYGRVVIPEAVHRELQDRRTPAVVAEWIAHYPEWLSVERAPSRSEMADEKLGDGEREAMALAEAHRPDVLLLIDEQAGREEARRRQLRTTGTLGILEDATERGFVQDLPAVMERLLNTTFHVSPKLIKATLDRHNR